MCSGVDVRVDSGGNRYPFLHSSRPDAHEMAVNIEHLALVFDNNSARVGNIVGNEGL